MNKDQIKGSVREAVGKVQKNVGRSTANGTLAVKGAAKEVAGKVQKAYGDAKEDQRTKHDRDIDRHAGE
jgi:uncharacterized protein YjbJ (UPF0337 family)